MAKRIVEVVESDISGKPNAATVTFGLAGTWYEVDLTQDEEEGLKQALQSYLAVSRKGSRPPKKRQVPEMTAEERARIRDWAKKKGHKVPERGRIPKEIQNAYDEAHNISRRT
jgi:Lsr2 protein